MRERLTRSALVLGGVGVVAAGAIGVAAGTSTPQPVGVSQQTTLRQAAQNILETRGSLLSNATRLALGMAARGDKALSPGNPSHKDIVSTGRARLTARARTSTDPMSDGQPSAAPPTNIRVNSPAEDSHEVDQTTQSETAIAVSGAHVAVGFNDSQTGLLVLTAGDDLAGYAFSDDGGASFTDGGQLPNVPGFVNLGDPWMAVDPSGAIYYSNLALSGEFFGSLGVAVAKSTDGGHSWHTPTLVSQTNLFSFADKDSLAAGVGPNHAGSALYAAWDDVTFPFFGPSGGGGGGGGCPPSPSATTSPVGSGAPAGGTPTASGSPIGSPPPTPSPTPCPGPSGPMFGLAVSHSYDGGQTWAVSYADQIQQSGFCDFAQYIGATPLVNNGTGALYLAAERVDVSDPTCGQEPATITFSQRFFVSNDGGKTFGPGRTIATINPVASPFFLGPTSAMRDAEFPTMAIRNGNIYVAWNDGGSPTGSTQIRLARSSNGGSTWSSSFVTSGQGQRIQPALSSDASGLHLLYYRINPNLTLDAIASDSPGGSTWLARRLNSLSFPGVTNNPQFDPLVVPQYMGDYIANATDGTHRYYAWGDNRDSVTNFLWPRGRRDPDVFFART